MTQRIDIAGQVFGRLTVIAQAPNSGGKTRWLCCCECGNEIVVATRYLRRGDTASCGCLQRDIKRQRGNDLTGRVFGELTVLSHVINPSGNNTWLCRCSCGAEKNILGYALMHGHYTSCGCKRDVKRDKGLLDHITKDQAHGTRRSALTAKLHVHNSSGVKGVFFNRQRGKWIAYIGFQGKQINLGYYTRFDDAVTARKNAEDKYFKPIIAEGNEP